VPCDQELPLAATYRLAGHDVRASAPFQLEARPGERVVIEAKKGSKARFVGGIVVASAGLALAGVGALVLQNKALESAGYGPRTDNGPSKGAGEAMLAGGAAAMVGGALLATTNARSKADQSTASSASPPANDAWLRAPSRREGRADTTPSPGVPVVQMGF
jgi:hypothetical protein